MAKLLPNLRSLVKLATSLQDRNASAALRNLETWADDLTKRLAALDAGAVAGSGVLSVTAGSSAVTAAPTTGAVIVDVVPANFTGIPQAGVSGLVTALAGKASTVHSHSESDVTGLVGDLAGKQPLDATLTALAALDATAGLLEQTAADTFTKRAMGVAAGTSIPTRADADARFAAISHAHAQSDVTNLVTDLAAKQPLDATLTALAALDATAGLLEQTGADTFVRRAMGVGASTSIPTRADADARYAAISHTHAQADITNLVSDLAAKADKTTTISTTAPIAGGGDLSANRTFSLNADGITDALLRDSSALSVIGRSANSAGDPADIAAGVDGDVLRRSGTTLGFGAIPEASVTNLVTDLAAKAATATTISTTAPLSGGGDLSTNRTLSILADGITDALLRDSAATSVIGRSANSVGNPADIAASSDGDVLRRAGSVLGFGAIPQASVTSLVSDLALKAPLASPTFTGTATAEALVATGNVTIGNAASDAHTLLGTLDANGTSGTNGQVLKVVSGVPKWDTDAVGVTGGSGTNNRFTVWTAGGTAIGDSAYLTEQYGGYVDCTATLRVVVATASVGLESALQATTAPTAYAGDIYAANIGTGGTINATAAARTTYGIQSSATSSRSAGAFDLTNVGAYFWADSGQVNRALVTGPGDVILNDTGSGTTTIRGATTLTAGFTAGAACSMGSFKITNLANGSSAQDAAAFGQIATGAAAALAARTISTTSPLSGGGDLSANRTFSISTNGISNTLFRQSTALTVVGRSANSTGDVADISAGVDGDVLRRSGTTLGFGAIPQSSVTSLVSDLALKAPLASPTFTGTVTADVLTTTGNATIGNASADTHTLNGNLTLSNSPTAGPLVVGSLQARILLAVQTFTASGTYTPTTGARAVRVRMVGGGGGGGGSDGNGTGISTGAGGASGSYWEKYIVIGATFSGGSVTCGAAGTGGATGGGTGGTGGDSTVVINGTTYTAKGGLGGAYHGTSTSPLSAAGGLTQAATGTAADIADRGQAGHCSWSNGVNLAMGGAGGRSVLGGGGADRSGIGAGNAAVGPGGGGAGAVSTTVDAVGGAGFIGIVIIEEYA